MSLAPDSSRWICCAARASCRGAVSLDLMQLMQDDAMAIGNHEFEYGWEAFAREKARASFPVLGANLFYAGTEHRYA